MNALELSKALSRVNGASESETFTWMTVVIKSSFGRSEEVFPLRLRV